MLGLKFPTNLEWIDIVNDNIEQILIDHAFCEQKAASTAISLIVKFPEYKDLVVEMIDLAIEEMGHFKLVLKELNKRNYTLGKERKDIYVNKLHKFFYNPKTKNEKLINKLLIAALIEARSCERFKLISENINDTDLRIFYHQLMISEAKHYTLFLNLARKYGDRKDVDRKWNSLLDYESSIIKSFGKKYHIHG